MKKQQHISLINIEIVQNKIAKNYLKDLINIFWKTIYLQIMYRIKKYLYIKSLKYCSLEITLIVRSNFDYNFRNQLDLSISILEIDSKFNSISIILKLTRFDSSRFSISILEIKSNCQEYQEY